MQPVRTPGEVELPTREGPPASIAVGRFLTCFASIEALSYVVYELFPEDPLTTYGRNLSSFAARVRFAQALIRGCSLPKAHELERTFEKTLPLAKSRNQIAHNPPYTDLYEDPGTGELTSAPPTSRNNKSGKQLPVTLEGIEEQTKVAFDLYMEIIFLMREASGSE
jgi:hypothetical protein